MAATQIIIHRGQASRIVTLHHATWYLDSSSGNWGLAIEADAGGKGPTKGSFVLARRTDGSMSIQLVAGVCVSLTGAAWLGFPARGRSWSLPLCPLPWDVERLQAFVQDYPRSDLYNALWNSFDAGRVESAPEFFRGVDRTTTEPRLPQLKKPLPRVVAPPAPPRVVELVSIRNLVTNLVAVGEFLSLDAASRRFAALEVDW